MTKKDYVEKYTGKFIVIWTRGKEEYFYLYTKEAKRSFLFRDIGVYVLDFDFDSYSSIWNNDDYITIAVSEKYWMKKAIPCIFS